MPYWYASPVMPIQLINFAEKIKNKTPTGMPIIKDDNKTILEAKFDKDEILKVRKYIDIGLN